MTTIGTAVLEIIPSLRGVSDAIDKGTRELKITPKVDMSGARSSGQRAGNDINSGLESANIGRGVSTSLGANLVQGAEAAGRRMGSLIATGLKTTAIAGGALLAAGIGGALHAGLGRLEAIDDAKFKLQGLGNTAQQTQAIMDNALAAVKGTAYGLDEAATTAASAVAAGIAPGKQLTDYLKLTADTAAIAGTSLADMGAIFNQVQTSGKAFTGDLNQLADRGLPIFQWLQDEYKVSGAALSKMVSDGKVDAATFQKVVAEHISGAAQNMGGSIRGQLSNLKAAYSRFGAELAGPIFAAVSPLTKAFTGAFDKVTTAIKPFTAQLTAIIGPWATNLGNKITAWLDNGGVQKIVDWFSRLRTTFEGLASGGGSGALKTITDGVQNIGPVLAQAGPALSSFAGAMGDFGKAIIAVGPQTLTDFLVPSLHVFGDALKFVADHASWAVPVLGGLVLAFAGFKVVGDTVGPIFSALNGAFKIINTPIMLAQTAAIRAQAAAMTELSTALSVNTVAAGENAAMSLGGAATAAKGLTAEAGTAASALGGLGGAAEKGAGGIVSALSKVAIPAWLAYLVYNEGKSLFDNATAGDAQHPGETTPSDPTGAKGDQDRHTGGIVMGVPGGYFPAGHQPPRPDAPYVPTGATSGALTGPQGTVGIGGGAAGNAAPPGYQIPGKKDLFGNGYALGGPIRGPGTGISDSILLRASNGEFLVNADATRKNLPLLEIINSGKLPGFANGGMVGADVQAAQDLVGTPYSMAKRFDCSGDVARVINAALGIPGGDLMTTASASKWLSARGFKPGIGGPGTISVGWKNGGPGGGHMAMTLSDGRNAEGGGSHPNFMIGGAAAGASSGQFTDHMFLALAAASGGDGKSVASGQGDDNSATPTADSPSTASSGGGVSLPSSLSGLSSFSLSSFGKGVGTTGNGSDLSVFGNAAATAVSGQVSSALGVFGAGDTPPFLQAASQLLGGIKVGGHTGPGKSDGSLFDGSNLFGQGHSAAPLSASSTGTGASLPDEPHGTRAGQAPGPQTVINIRTATTEDAFVRMQRLRDERAAAKLSVY